MVSEGAGCVLYESPHRVLILVLVEDGLGVAAVRNYTESAIWCLNPCFSGGWSRSTRRNCGRNAYSGSLNPCFSGGWSRRATFGIGCQRDCCNEIFNFVNVWRPKICTFSGAFTGANIRIIFVNGAFFDAGFRAIFAFLSAMGRIAMGGYRWSGLTRDAECRFFFVGGDVADSKFGCG